MVIWKYDNNGTLDTSFDNDSIVSHHGAAGGSQNDGGNDIILDDDGNIYVTDYSDPSDESKVDMVIWKYTNSGLLDTTFDR